MPTGEQLGRSLARLERGGLLLGGFAIAVAAAGVVLASGELELALGSGGAWAAAALAYFGSHMTRAIRLAYLASGPAASVRSTAAIHWYCAGLSVLLPFKLGDVVRVERVARLRGDARDAVAVVWLERSLDAAAIVAAITLIAVTGASTEGLRPVLLVTATFVTLTVLASTVLPTNIRELMLHLVRRDYGPASVHALRLLRAILDTIDRVPRLVHRRLSALLVMTVLIWSLEFAALGLALDALDTGFQQLAGTMLRALTGVALEAVPIAPSATQFMSDLLPHLEPVRLSEYRLLLVAIPLAGGLLATPIAARLRPGAS
ncbi:MAG: lysylphosphatidylglycerol synthase domain-containing protein [Patulibacter sp.]